jgi:UDP-N-acetylglucosamine 2-epimerase (non-hydrolysing)
VNLAKEGIPAHRMVMVGNVMIDTLLSAREQALRSPVLAELGLGARYGVVTLHRPSNVDNPVVLKNSCKPSIA